jgi:phosphatidylglycerol:prolipoprotein diacylglycerol transferase
MAFVLFACLWALRRTWAVPGLLFSVYLMVNGLERLLIEQIRVNAPMELGGLAFTQAELIAVLTMIGGVVLFAVLKRRAVAG